MGVLKRGGAFNKLFAECCNDSKLTFANHISEKISKACKGIGVVKYLSSNVMVKTLDQIYKMYLDFCDVIYHIPEIDIQDSRFKIQDYIIQQKNVYITKENLRKYMENIF